MKTTKSQRKQLLQLGVGVGFIALKTGENEITEIEVYVGRDNVLRRVGNGEPLLPITLCDDGECFEIESAT